MFRKWFSWRKDASFVENEPVADANSESVNGNDYIRVAAKDIISAYFSYLDSLDMAELYAELDTMEEELPEFESALDTIADTATQGEHGDEYTFAVKTPNSELMTLLNSLYDRVKMHDIIWGIARDVVKYGNEFDYIVIQDNQIIDLETLPVYVMRRRYLTDKGQPKDMYYRVDYTNSDTVLQEYAWNEVIHWRWKVPRSGFMRDSEYYPPLYGRGLGISFLKTYKKLLLLEDSLVLGRLTRAIAKIVYKLDTGNIHPTKAEEYLNKKKATLGRRKYIDAATGRLSETTNPLQDEDDIFLEVRPGSESDVKALNLSQNMQWIGDVQYIQNKLFCALRTPKGYLNYEKDLNARATLLKQDVQYGRWIRRLQSALTFGIKELGKLQMSMQSSAYATNSDAILKRVQFMLRDHYTLPQVATLRAIYTDSKDTDLVAKQLYRDTKRSDVEIEAIVRMIDKSAATKEVADQKVDFDIVFPAVSVDDELTRAEVYLTKSKMAIAISSLALMSRADILTEVFEYTKDEAEELIAAANEDYGSLSPTKKKSVKDAAESVLHALTDDLGRIVNDPAKFSVKDKKSQKQDVDNS